LYRYDAVPEARASVPVPERTPAEPTKSTAGPPHETLTGECNSVIAQFVHVPALRDAIQQRDELQSELDTLKVSRTYRASARVGKALQAAKLAVTQQPLSEEDYLALADRHASLVQAVTAECDNCLDNDEFDALDTLAAKLEELQALDVSALPQSWANDPVRPPAPPAPTVTAEEEEDDGTNDPVCVSAAPGATRQGTVPPTCTATSATAEDREEKCLQPSTPLALPIPAPAPASTAEGENNGANAPSVRSTSQGTASSYRPNYGRELFWEPRGLWR
jgi:hypothetical protein